MPTKRYLGVIISFIAVWGVMEAFVPHKGTLLVLNNIWAAIFLSCALVFLTGIRSLRLAVKENWVEWWKVPLKTAVVMAVICAGIALKIYLENRHEIRLVEEKRQALELANIERPILPASVPDPAAGKAVFIAYCATCHGADGKGGVGNDLTDNEWIRGTGDETSVIDIVANGGRKGKSMKAWGHVLDTVRIQQVAHYVTTLRD